MGKGARETYILQIWNFCVFPGSRAKAFHPRTLFGLHLGLSAMHIACAPQPCYGSSPTLLSGAPEIHEFVQHISERNLCSHPLQLSAAMLVSIQYRCDSGKMSSEERKGGDEGYYEGNKDMDSFYTGTKGICFSFLPSWTHLCSGDLCVVALAKPFSDVFSTLL